jgi:exonuclease III
MEKYAEHSHAAGRELLLCGDINITRTDMDVHPKERRPNCIGQLSEEREVLEDQPRPSCCPEADSSSGLLGYRDTRTPAPSKRFSTWKQLINFAGV